MDGEGWWHIWLMNSWMATLATHTEYSWQNRRWCEQANSGQRGTSQRIYGRSRSICMVNNGIQAMRLRTSGQLSGNLWDDDGRWTISIPSVQPRTGTSLTCGMMGNLATSQPKASHNQMSRFFDQKVDDKLGLWDHLWLLRGRSRICHKGAIFSLKEQGKNGLFSGLLGVLEWFICIYG